MTELTGFCPNCGGSNDYRTVNAGRGLCYCPKSSPEQSPDLLEQKAREFWAKKLKENPTFCFNHLSNPMQNRELACTQFAASFAREIVEQAAKAVCLFCRSDGVWNPAVHDGMSWCHQRKSNLQPLVVYCDSRGIWETFGKKS